MDGSKPWWQSKTLVFNLLAIALAVATAFGFTDFQPEAWTSEVIVVIVGLINIGLRLITTRPIS